MGFFGGIIDLLSGAGIIITNKALRPYLWAPLLINVVVYALVVGLGIYFFADLVELFIPTGEGWYYSLLRIFAWVVFTVTLTVAVFFSFFAIACLIASPFNEILSAKYEELITGVRIDDGFGIGAGLWQESKRLLIYLPIICLLLILTLILSFIPFLNLAVPVIWIVFGGLMAAFEFVSYPLDRRGMGLGAKLGFLRRNFMRNEGFGIAVYLAMLVPVLNIMVIPSAVIGATRIVASVEGKVLKR